MSGLQSSPELFSGKGSELLRDRESYYTEDSIPARQCRKDKSAGTFLLSVILHELPVAARVGIEIWKNSDTIGKSRKNFL